MIDFPRVRSLEQLGWSQDLAPEGGPPMDGRGTRPARIVMQSASAWHVHDGVDLIPARARSRVRRASPTTGDWVLVSGQGEAVIEEVLPRRTTLARASAGGDGVPQFVAANVDLVGICAAAGDVNPRRLERELTAAWGSGAEPVVVITKADDERSPGSAAAQATQVAIGVRVITTSARTGLGLVALAALLRPNVTMALMGPSGVGKSSVVNALAEVPVLATSEVRRDGKGRHTTTSRILVPIAGGGLILDTPGMREFSPWFEGDGVESAFPDIDDLARECRFGDCRHNGEPGCRVLAAATGDEALARRVENWRTLQREQAWLERRHDRRAMAEERRRWAAISRSMRGRSRP